MAVTYATEADFLNPNYTHLYSGITGGINPNDYPIYKAAQLKKIQNNPYAGSDVNNPSLAPGWSMDPNDPTKAFKLGVPPPDMNQGFDFQSLLNQFLSQGPATSTAPKPSMNLTGGVMPFGGNSDKLFEEYLKSVGAPSSVDEVQRGLETEALKQTEQGVDRDVAQSLAATRLDALDRGIGGPGQYGDIEANALAQVRAGGDRTKAAARNAMSQAELTRQKAREEAKTTALGERYKAGVTTDAQARAIAADLMKTQYQGDIALSEGEATRASSEKINMVKTLLDYAVETGKMSQQDKQFYDGLLAQAEQNALGYAQNRSLAEFNKGPAQPGFGQQLFQDTVTAILSTVAGKATGKILK
jgi:hypothetical protein